jgi:hypothetical protein
LSQQGLSLGVLRGGDEGIVLVAKAAIDSVSSRENGLVVFVLPFDFLGECELGSRLIKTAWLDWPESFTKYLSACESIPAWQVEKDFDGAEFLIR